MSILFVRAGMERKISVSTLTAREILAHSAIYIAGTDILPDGEYVVESMACDEHVSGVMVISGDSSLAIIKQLMSCAVQETPHESALSALTEILDRSDNKNGNQEHFAV